MTLSHPSPSTSAASSMLRLSNLINQAMTMLWENGDPHATLQLLCQGYAEVTTSLASQTLRQDEEQEHEEGSTSGYRISTVELGDVLGPEAQQQMQQQQEQSAQNPFFLFRHVLFLDMLEASEDGEDAMEEEDETTTIDAATSTNALGLLAVVLAYNIGILLHSMALLQQQHSSNPTQSMAAFRLARDARAWYQAALMAWNQWKCPSDESMQSQSQSQSQAQHHPLIPQALFTNLGHVALLLNDTKCMGICQKHLQQERSFYLPQYEQRQREESDRHLQMLSLSTSHGGQVSQHHHHHAGVVRDTVQLLSSSLADGNQSAPAA